MPQLVLTRAAGFPDWLDLKDSGAREGTRIVRSIVDPEFTIVFNRRCQRYELWVPSLSAGGWVCQTVIIDQYGRELLPPIPWQQIARQWKQARDSEENAAERVARHNQQLSEQRDREFSEAAGNVVDYLAPAVSAILGGASRWSVADIQLGVRNAREGRSKSAPVGRIISVGR